MVKKREKGLTLVELLVSLAIVGVLTSLGFAAFGRYNRSRRLSEAGEQLVADLRLVQTMAVAGRKPLECEGALIGYEVECKGGTSEYSARAFCGDTSFLIDTYQLPYGVEFLRDERVMFYPLNEGVEEEKEIGLVLEEKALAIKVEKEGAIYSLEMEGVPTPTPIPTPTPTPTPTPVRTPAPTPILSLEPSLPPFRPSPFFRPRPGVFW